MSTPIKNVAIIGASGNLGPSILNALLAEGSFTVTVLSRLKSKATFPDSVRVIKTDFSDASLIKDFAGQDAVISTVGSEAVASQTRYIDAAIAAGVKRFIPSEFGSDGSDPKALEIAPIFAPKLKVLRYLEEKASETFSYTAVITGPFFDWGIKIGFLAFDLKAKSAKIWDDGKVPFSGTNLSTIGKTVVAILSPKYIDETKNKEVFVASHTVSQSQILAGFEKISGEKWAVEKIDSRPVHERALASLKAGDYGFGTIGPLILTFTFGANLGGLSDISGKLWNEKLGLPKEDLEQDLKDILAGKKP